MENEENNTKNEMSLALIESIGDPLTNLSENVGELVLDSILEDGLLREIPFFSTLIGISKIGFKIRERLFAKKVFKILYRA